VNVKALTAAFLLALCFAFGAQSASAGEAQKWHHTSFDKAKTKAAKKGMPLFIYLHKPDCGRCISTWNGINNDPVLQKRLKKEVVLVYVDTAGNRADFQKAYASIRSKGGSFGTPLIGIVGKDGKVLVDNEGYASVAQINGFLDKIK
jgi:thioredoxin-related protein